MMDNDLAYKRSNALIVHLCQLNDWQETISCDTYQPSSLDEEGFIHCSRPDQIMTVANTLYRDVPDMVLLWIDPSKVDAEILWEQAGNETYPHIYGELNLDAVVEVTTLNHEV